MSVEKYEMTDEEFQLFDNKFTQICETLEGLPVHLVTPLLLRVTVGTYLDIKGFKGSQNAVQLAQSLLADLTETLYTKTNKHIIESN